METGRGCHYLELRSFLITSLWEGFELLHKQIEPVSKAAQSGPGLGVLDLDPFKFNKSFEALQRLAALNPQENRPAA